MDQSIDECQETLMMIEGKSELHGPLVPTWTDKLVPILSPDLQFNWPRAPSCRHHYENLILFLVYRHEFIELKKLLELKQEYDFDNNNGKNSMRGISWEVRKTSPGPRKHSTDGINETKIR